MSRLQARCPHCRRKMELKHAGLVGKKVRCPSCSEPFTIEPIASEAPPPAPKGSAPVPRGQSASDRPSRAKAGAVAPVTRKPAPTRKKPADDDEIPFADEIVEEGASKPAGGDSWLSELDSLLPDEAAATPVAAPPPIPGRRKKKPESSGKKRKRSRLRDAEGDMPLELHRLIMIGTGLLAGLFATVVWGGLIYRTGEPSRYFAIFVGTCVGGGVRLGASRWDYGWWPAVTASLIAFTSIIGGKVAGHHLLAHAKEAEARAGAAAQVAALQHEDYPVHLLAFEIEAEQPAAYVPVDLTGDDYEGDDPSGPASWPEQHGPEVWAKAKQRWKEMSPEERKPKLDQIAEQVLYLQAMADGTRYRPARGVADADVEEGEAAADGTTPAVSEGETGEATQESDGALGEEETAAESFDEGEFARDYDDGKLIGGTRILSPWDFLFAIFAIVAAFKLAAGWNDPED